MLNQYAVDNPTLPVNHCFFHFIQILVLCQAVLWECRAATMRHQVFGTHMVKKGNVSANPTASSSALYPQESNPWISNVSEHTSPHVMGRILKETWADQQRLQISDPHFDKYTMPATFACWKIRFKTELCIRSQFLTEATLWIKEVELVDSVDDLKSSCSLRAIQMPNFEVLDAKIASALNRVIHNTQIQKKGQFGGTKSPKRGPFLSWNADRLLDLRILPGHWSQ